MRAGGDYPDVHFLRGELHRAGGDRDRASVEFIRAIKRNADYEPARQALHEQVEA